MRPSNTEPLLRLNVEGGDVADDGRASATRCWRSSAADAGTACTAGDLRTNGGMRLRRRHHPSRSRSPTSRLAEAGRHQLRLAENEMPGLMALRDEFGRAQPLAGARIAGLAAHDGADRRAHRDARRARRAGALGELQHLLHAGRGGRGGRRRARPAPSTRPAGVPVFAWKGETLEEYWWCTDRIFDWTARPTRRRRLDGPNMILDDGGDATLLVHQGREFEAAGVVPDATRTPRATSTASCSTRCAARSSLDPSAGPASRPSISGVTEETTTGVHRLYELAADGELLFPAINVNDSVTKSQVRQQVRHPALAARRPEPCDRRAHRRQGRVRRRLRRRRQGRRRGAARAGRARHRVARSTRSARCRPRWTATRSPASSRSIGDVDILVTGTGNKDVVTVEHLLGLKHLAIVANVGHFDNEIDMAGLEALARAPRRSRSSRRCTSGACRPAAACSC